MDKLMQMDKPTTAIDFYQNHLDRVSRSFAACIARLESPLRSWVSLTYLICRILDTVEDAKWQSLKEQDMSFMDFDKFLKSEATVDEVAKWTRQFPNDLSEGEGLLVQDAERIFSDLHKSPPQIKMVIQSLVGSMSAGMRHFARRKMNGAMRLSGLKEVNQYCFFVAGIVGETLSKLLVAVDSKVKVSQQILRDAHHFGLFLQKVNLLKDQYTDETEGRFLIPSREAVILSLRENSEGAMRYIESIPLEHKGYRVFCLWSLFLGVKTLPILTGQTSESDLNKISRTETMQLFQLIEEYASSPHQIREAFNALMQSVNWPDVLVSTVMPSNVALSSSASTPNITATPDVEVMRCYQGALSFEDLKALGLT